MAETQRKLAAIFASDAVGFSRMMGEDEERTLATLNACREIIDVLIEEYDGKVFGAAGDSVIAEFASPVDAVRSAVDIQRALRDRNAELPPDKHMQFRVGINVGDVIVEGDNLFGDGVNIAARLESIAEPGGVCISESVYQHVRSKLDLEFCGLGNRTLKNIAEPVPVYRIELNGPADPDTTVNSAVKTGTPPEDYSDDVSEQRAIAVLPFDNMSGDAEQGYFADGLTEDIITALSHCRSFPVISRNSTFAYKGRSPDVRQIARELGCRYVLEGSVRHAGTRIRITAQLIEATTGHHLWAERLDRPLDDVFAVQDEITERIAATIVPEMERAEQVRSVAKPATNLAAWDYYLRGLAHLYEFSLAGNAQAREMFGRALDLDPGYARAHAGLAYAHHRDIMLGATSGVSSTIDACFAAARLAVELDDGDSMAHMLLGLAYMWRCELDLAIGEQQRALTLNPSDAVAHLSMGAALMWRGDSEEAIPHAERALRMVPQDPRNHIYMALLAQACFDAGRLEQAMEWSQQAIQRRPSALDGHLVLSAVASGLGQADLAKRAAARCAQIEPDYVNKWMARQNYADDAIRKRWRAVLCEALD